MTEPSSFRDMLHRRAVAIEMFLDRAITRAPAEGEAERPERLVAAMPF